MFVKALSDDAGHPDGVLVGKQGERGDDGFRVVGQVVELLFKVAPERVGIVSDVGRRAQLAFLQRRRGGGDWWWRVLVLYGHGCGCGCGWSIVWIPRLLLLVVVVVMHHRLRRRLRVGGRCAIVASWRRRRLSIVTTTVRIAALLRGRRCCIAARRWCCRVAAVRRGVARACIVLRIVWRWRRVPAHGVARSRVSVQRVESEGEWYCNSRVFVMGIQRGREFHHETGDGRTRGCSCVLPPSRLLSRRRQSELSMPSGLCFSLPTPVLRPAATFARGPPVVVEVAVESARGLWTEQLGRAPSRPSRNNSGGTRGLDEGIQRE